MSKTILSIVLPVTLVICCPCVVAATTTAPSTTQAADEYEAGLLMQVYRMPRMPRRLRRLIPGQAPAVTRIIPSLELRGRDDFGGFDQQFQVEITGQLLAGTSGEYLIECAADDGVELYLDDRKIIVHDGVHGMTPPVYGKATLEAGWHSIRIRHFQGDGGFGLVLRWQEPDQQSFQAIDTRNLRVGRSVVLSASTQPASRPATLPSTRPGPELFQLVYASEGFALISEPEADLLIELLEGPTQISRAAGRDLAEGLADIHYLELKPRNQARYLSGFLRSAYQHSTSRTFRGNRAEFVLSEPEPVESFEGWRGAKLSGRKYTLNFVDQQTVVIYTPDADSTLVERIANALAGLPASFRRLVRTVRHHPNTANEYNGGGSEIWIRLNYTPSQQNIDNALAHEVGHLAMHRTGCEDRWQLASDLDMLSVSGYGRRNNNEDFAEFVRLYLDCVDDPQMLLSLQILYPHRWEVFQELLKELEE